MKKIWILLTVLSLAVFGAFAQEDTGTEPEETQETSEPMEMSEGETLLDIIASAPEFSTLFTAIQAAGLETELETAEYTVFAPTNNAFDALPEGELDSLLADPVALQSLLLNHLAVGTISSGELVGFGSVTTATGEFLMVNPSTDGVVDVGDAIATETIEASNGIIYVIDTVLVPNETADEDTDDGM
jgi:transforming growth factor-beta-induced protein